MVFDCKWYKLKSHGSEHWIGLSDLMECEMGRCKLEENVNWEREIGEFPS